mgnify:FL=1
MPDLAVMADASCLIVLDKVDGLPLLPALYGSIWITQPIADEYGTALPEWIAVKDTPKSPVDDLLRNSLGQGEAAAIALALSHRDAHLLILDDLKARKIARQLNLNLTGTLGVVARAKQRGIISAAKPVFEKILATDFRASSAVVDALLQELGE